MTSTELVLKDKQSSMMVGSETTKQFVTMRVNGQLFGIPVLNVQDVLRPQRITKVPLAPSIVSGSINLRGRIVTVVDVRTRLGLSPASEEDYMLVVVPHMDDLYSLKVDKVGDVLSLPVQDFERNPSNLDGQWRELSLGVYRLEKEIMLVVNVANLLEVK